MFQHVRSRLQSSYKYSRKITEEHIKVRIKRFVVCCDVDRFIIPENKWNKFLKYYAGDILDNMFLKPENICTCIHMNLVSKENK